MVEADRVPDVVPPQSEPLEANAGLTFSRRVSPYFRHTSMVAGALILVVVLVLAVGASLFTHVDPLSQDPNVILQAPNAKHLMGTDQLGRDIYSRVLYGGRYTMGASVMVVLIGASIGSFLGLLAGFRGGFLDIVIMRFMDLLLAFPGILLALVIATIVGSGLLNAVVAVGVASIPVYARVVQGATIEAKTLPYAEAAVALGGGALHVVRRHILPTVRSQIIVLSTAWLGVATLFVAGLGFLGLGLEPPTPEWGAILNDGRNFVAIAWWVSLFPGIFITLFVIATNLIGDGLRDIIDPTVSRGQ